MKRKLLKKLRSKAGETLAEVLISLLISSLALVILAQMISASSSMITNSEKKMAEYYTARNVLDNQTDVGESGSTLTLKENPEGASAEIADQSFNIIQYKNNTVGGITVISYKEATA